MPRPSRQIEVTLTYLLASLTLDNDAKSDLERAVVLTTCVKSCEGGWRGNSSQNKEILERILGSRSRTELVWAAAARIAVVSAPFGIAATSL